MTTAGHETSAAMLPPSPLEAFRRGIGQVLRTGLSPAFEGAATSSSTAAAAVRRGARRVARWTGPTAGLAPGHAQASLVCVPKAHAFDFARFCLLNPRPCPLLAIAATPTDLSQEAGRGATSTSRATCRATASGATVWSWKMSMTRRTSGPGTS